MSQYYKAAVIRKDSLKTFGFRAAKLTEHSLVGNGDVDKVMWEILNNPGKVAWVGEYSLRRKKPGKPGKDRFFCLTRRGWARLYQRVWLNNNEEWDISDCENRILGRCVLLNHSKKQAIDIRNMKEGSVHPLPILTACGNGRGSGDYHGRNSVLAGFWAGDTLETAFKIPDGYKTIDPHFATFEYMLEKTN
jgi:hypothetical protein